MQRATTYNKSNNLNNSSLPIHSNVKVLSRDEEGRLFLKVFLIDNTVNGNQWGVDPSTVDNNIKTAIGKPLVLYRDTGNEPDRSWFPRIPGMYNHPPWDDVDLQHTLDMQETYRVGTIIDVVKNTETDAWWGIVEVTNEGVKEALNENPTLPFYVSPSIRRMHTLQANEMIRDWTFMHTAIVSIPAFGVQKAYVARKCNGDKETCVLQFRNASLAAAKAEGHDQDCGFCTYQAMLEVEEQMAIDTVLEAAGAAEETLTAARRKKKKLGPHAADRPDSDFAYIPKEAKGKEGSKSARKFPIFDAAHVRNALARFSQANLPPGQKSAVLSKICRAAKRFKIDSELCRSKSASASSFVRNLENTGWINSSSGTTQQTNNLNTSHVTTSTNFQIERTNLSESNQQSEVAVVENATTLPEGELATERTTTARSEELQQQKQQTPQQSIQEQGTDNKGSSSAKQGKLLELLVANERRKNQLDAAYHEINKLARDNRKLANEANSSSSRLAAMERYITEQQKIAREEAIADIVYGSNLAQFIPDDQKEEQVRLLLDSDYKLEDIQKLTAPWYQAFDSFVNTQKEKGADIFQEPQKVATKVASYRLPLRDTHVKTASQQQPQTENTKKPTMSKPAFIEVKELMGLVDSSNGSGGVTY